MSKEGPEEGEVRPLTVAVSIYVTSHGASPLW